MSRVRSFFLREAGECLAEIRTEVAAKSLDVGAVHAAVRRFRGSAQMARFEEVARKARALERRLREHGAEAEPEAEGALRREIGEGLSVLGAAVEAVREGRLEEDPRMEAGMEEREDQASHAGEDVVPIDALEYRGEAALERALDLRAAVEDVIVSEAPAGPVLDELFDLIRLGAK